MRYLWLDDVSGRTVARAHPRFYLWINVAKRAQVWPCVLEKSRHEWRSLWLLIASPTLLDYVCELTLRLLKN